MLAAAAVLVGVGTLIANRVQADYPMLASEVRRTVHEVQNYLAGPPFRLRGIRLDQLSSRLLNYLAQHKSVVAGTVVTGGRYFLEVLTGIILTLFITFFLLKDGRKIWSWLISGLRPMAHRRAVMAGDAAWQALVGYIRGTTVVAAIHAIFIGLALWLLGVPLVVPLVMLVFIAAYVPLIGILVVGALAIVITLATKGCHRRGHPARGVPGREPDREPPAPAARGRQDRPAASAGHHRGAGRGRYRGRHSWRDHRGACIGHGHVRLALPARRS